jgi:hypothetical protein
MWNTDILSKRFHQSDQIESKRKNSKKAHTDVMAVEGDVVNEIGAVDAAKIDCDKSYLRVLYRRPQMLTAVIQDKLKADFVEALIGAYYLSGGLEASTDIIKIFGLLSPRDDGASAAIDQSELFIPAGYPENLLRQISSKTTVSSRPKEYGGKWCDDDYREYCISPTDSDEDLISSIHRTIGYRFRSIKLLREALTHDTMVSSSSNQRLEFLGDAVLDFIVCSSIFKNCPFALCGDISLGKSTLTNNKMLAQFSYKSQVYRYLRLGSKYLFHQFLRINNEFLTTGKGFIGDIIKIDKDVYQGQKQANNFKSEGEQFELFLGDASKPLADLFEAMIGAIYLDSNHDLTQCVNMLKFIEVMDIAVI